jgi:transposase
LPDEIDDGRLEEILYSKRKVDLAGEKKVMPDFAYIHAELRRKHVTLSLLWQEYRLAHGSKGYQYARYCELYRLWCGPLDAVLRQEHKAGEKTFVDWSGDGIEIVNRETGEVWEAPLFVGVLGASSYTFAKAAPSRAMPNWLSLHSEMFEYFEGVTAVTVPDNEKTGVTLPCLYDPEINRTYAAWAEHYGTVILPARPRKPKDKSLAENAVLNAQRWILGALRNHRFFSVEQANLEIARLLEAYNARLLQKLKVSRASLHKSLDKPLLRPLPAKRFEPFSWADAKVNIDYHVEVEKHRYSVPYTLIHKKVEVRWTETTVEVFYNGRRVASHQRGFVPFGYTTIAEHRPEKHNAVLNWSPERFTKWATKMGPKTEETVASILAAKKLPEYSYRACLGLLRLGRKYGEDNLEAACARALGLASPNYRTVNTILKSGAHRLPAFALNESNDHQTTLPHHENIRGAAAYH